MNYRTLIAVPAALVALFAVSFMTVEANDGGGAAKDFFRVPTVTIGAGGNALVRGAEVTAVDGGTLTATTEWGNASVSWTIETDADTDFVGNDDGLADIAVGDEISFAGSLTSWAKVDATTVREWPTEDDDTDEDTDDDSDHDKDGKSSRGWHLGEFWKQFIDRFHR